MFHLANGVECFGEAILKKELEMDRRNYSRRQFARLAGAGVVAALSTGERAWSAPASKPNILVIMSDEHNARVMGCMNDGVIQTPSLDALAKRGVVFENCYCNSPLCVPSRLSFTSGKYASRVGGWSNSCWLPSPDYPSLPSAVKGAGYDAYLCGKMHYDASCRYGFTEIGGNRNDHTMTGKGKRRAADDLAPAPGYSKRFENCHIGETSTVLEHDRNVTKGTIEFLQTRKATDAPFFLLSGYLAPHFPLIIPEKYWLPYQGKIPMPVIPDGFLDGMPLNYKHLRLGFHVENVPGDVVRRSRELYYGLVQWVDEEIGKVLKVLASSGVADNTVVIYTSDHGENMGEHGLWWKNCVYDTAARVPLIVSWPARWNGGQRRTQVCSLVDVVQTIADLCDAKTPDDWNGDSMSAWLDDATTPWKDFAVSEYYAHNIASGYSMLRAGDFKYVYHARPTKHHEPERELYNLKADPGEFTNLAKQSGYADRINAMHLALVKEIGEDPETTEGRCRVDIARGYTRPDGRTGKDSEA
jgi:choline-sulfatase